MKSRDEGSRNMRIAVANDHAGFEFKKKLQNYLEEKGHVVENFGCNDSNFCDYPDFAIPAIKSIVNKKMSGLSLFARLNLKAVDIKEEFQK